MGIKLERRKLSTMSEMLSDKNKMEQWGNQILSKKQVQFSGYNLAWNIWIFLHHKGQRFYQMLIWSVGFLIVKIQHSLCSANYMTTKRDLFDPYLNM